MAFVTPEEPKYLQKVSMSYKHSSQPLIDAQHGPSLLYNRIETDRPTDDLQWLHAPYTVETMHALTCYMPSQAPSH